MTAAKWLIVAGIAVLWLAGDPTARRWAGRLTDEAAAYARVAGWWAAAPARGARWLSADAEWRWHRHRDWVNGVDLHRFWSEQIRNTRPDRRIRTRAHHRLTGGRP